MPKAFTERENELIGERLVEHGYRLFSAYGLRKTTVEELAEAAGISKGAFYNFYASKEALFMDVMELAEERYRQELLATVDLPGPTPRARLLAVFKKASSLLETIPMLGFLSGGDYERLSRRVPAEKLQEHLASDRLFFERLVARCQEAGIPIQVKPEAIGRLLYPLVLPMLQQDFLAGYDLGGGVDALLELVAAFCLGEVEIELQ